MLTDAIQSTAPLSGELDALACRLLAAQLRGLGLHRGEDLHRLATQHGRAAPDYFHAWLAESLRYVAGVEAGDPDALWQQWHERLTHWRQDADLAARAMLLDACLKGLPALLTGAKPATRILFPEGSMALVEGVYKNNRISDYFNQVLIEAALATLESRPADAGPLRILEIGAGTGGATAGLLAALAPWRRQIGEYCYTDLSQAFLQHGAQAFGRDNPFLQTRLFDVSRPCAEQGIATDHYHLVVANNVLHATPEIRQSLRHAKAALRKGGLLMLNEISEASLFTHLSFGLLEGWWRYRDGALRIPGCPGLSPAGWQAVLEQEGFSPVLFPARPAHGLGQQVILAESDGIVRQPAAGAGQPAPPLSIARRQDGDAGPAQDEAAPDSWRQQVGACLRALVASTLKIPADKMSLSRPLVDYGLDSILVVRLTAAFNEYFDAVDSALFFEIPTLAALTEHFIQHRDAELKTLLKQPDIEPPSDKQAAAAQPVPEPMAPSTPQTSHTPGLDRTPATAAPAGRDGADTVAIAIIGLDGRYPGAESMAAFWRNVAGGHCTISEIPADRWDWRRYFDPEKGKAGHIYTRWGGFLDGIDRFDPAFFRISRREAERMDPQERLFLEVAYHSIEDAGYNPAALHRQGEVGVFVGVMNGGYNPIGNHWSIANRVSYQLDLKGPSFVVDSACSSSLTAIHLAAESLANGSCGMAIAGGVNLIVNPHHYLGLCEMMMLSPGERCCAFGHDADGFVDGEGVGAVVLKPLNRAIADGDRIYGVIRGSAINAGGKTNGYTVPSAGAQQRVLEKALSRSAIGAGRISYIEAHGTGTALGDPVEISGLGRVFADRDGAAGTGCAIGSVKSNIGHCESAAGIAGLSKVLLQLKHRQLAPSLHAGRPNPKIDFEHTPFRVQQQLAPWPDNGATRVAAISSFGAGGANASLIVEEYAGAVDPRPAAPGPWLILLSARDSQRLAESVSRLQDYLDSEDGRAVEMADLAFTLQVGREAMAARLACVVDGAPALRRGLAHWLAGEPADGVFHGHADPLDEAPDAPLSGTEQQKQVGRWLEQHQLAELAALWVRGGEIDWSRLQSDRARRQPMRVSLPGYPFARNRYWMPGLAHPVSSRVSGNGNADARAAASQPSAREALADSDLADCCYLPRWQPQAATEPLAAAGPGAVVLVAGEHRGTAAGLLLDTLAGHYRDHRRVVRIDGGAGVTAELADGRWRCGDDDPQGFARILAAVGEVAQIVVIGPEARSDLAPQALADSLQHNELPLLRLFKALQQHLAANAAMDCFLLSQRRYAFAGEPCPGNPYGAGMTGLGYAMAQSDHRVRLRNLDIDPAELDAPDGRRRLLAQILAEPASERGEPVKLSRGERFVQQLTPLALPASGDSRSALKREGVYLILGGSGVIGQVISRQLIEHCQARVIWLGRKAADSLEVRQSLAASHFHGRVDYLQADATELPQLQRAVAQINQRYGRIDGAVFAGMVFDFENSIQQTSEAQFRQILDVKSRGGIHFYQALAGQSLDFLCYCSSGQGFAFSGAAKLSAYACGITFADAFAEAVRPAAAFPVGVINWGFWRASLRAQAVSHHMDALDDDEGFACFSRFVANLAGGSLPRLLCLKASPAVRQLMAVPPGRQCRLDPPAAPVQAPPGVELEPAERSRLQQAFDSRHLDQSIAVLLLIQVQTLGVFTAPGQRSAQAWRQQAGIGDRYRRWWAECLAILVEHGYLQQQGETFGLAVPIAEARHGAIWAAWREQLGHCLEDRDRRAQATLIDDCLRQLPQILTGRMQATDLLFPDGSMAKVEGIYQHNTLSDFFNDQLASLVTGQVRRLVEAEPGRPVRMLEIGAGTGGSTARLLAALEPLAGQIGEYCYTDLSRAFLQHGERCFAAGRPYFTTRILDIGQPVDDTQPAAGGYDIVIAANVLHATANMRRTLAHAKAMLRGGGLLALNELNRKTVGATVTFGLLDGWWLYEDPHLRIPGSPLLAEDSWIGLLESEGFRQVGLRIGQGDTLGQQIITAHSDGIILQDIGPQPLAAPPRQPDGAQAMADGHQAGEAGSSEALADRLQRWIIDALVKTLKADEASIAPRTPFSDYGVDSILGVGFVKHLGSRLGIKLNSAILFEHATVARLRDYLLQAHGAQIGRALAGSAVAHPVLAAAGDARETAPQAAPAVAAAMSPVVVAALGGAGLPAANESVVMAATVAPVANAVAGSRIAVIGLSGQFPGADHADALWDHLLAGRSTVEALPQTYLDRRAYSADKQPGKSNCNRAGILKDRDCFDPLFFSITPHEAESMTPHQRLVMQESWKALEDAGYNPMTLAGGAIGVYVGAEPGGYHHDSFTGSSEAIVASRLSYFLDLRGPAMVVNTGCSSSGVAIHLACESLRHGESTMALAGGVYALLDQRGLVSLSAIDMLSPSGQCHAFDAAADGTVISEGVGMVVLKRLEDAEADGDPIYGVIEASGVNQDGASNGITAPNGEAQERLICETYRKFAIDPAQISYVEAHGTGTRLGDPVEANALIRAFRRFTDAQGYCVLGSAKASLGHAAAGAGVIGLIKILLSMRHRMLPAMPGFERLNPLIELEGSPFHINRQAIDWRPSGGDRLLSALNAFGHSGTNAHLVIGEYLAGQAMDRRSEPPVAGRIVPLSAKTAESLRDNARALARWLDRQASPAPGMLADIALTMQTAREAMRVRAALVAADLPALQAQLARLADGDAPVLPADEAGRLAAEWAGGATIDWAARWPTGSARRIHLPGYQFAKERYWIDQAPQRGAATLDAVDSPVAPETTDATTGGTNPPGFATGLFLAQPVWGAPQGGAADDGACPRLLLRVGFDGEQSAQLQSLPICAEGGYHWETLASGKTAPAARYQELAIALLQRLQTLNGRVQIELLIAERTPDSGLDAGLDGLLKTACLEQPALSARCLLVKVDAGRPLSAAQLSELTAALSETLHGGRAVLQRSAPEGGRQELQWQALADAPVDDLAGDRAPGRRNTMPAWKDQGVYLITGGAGGLGLIFAKAIAEQCRDATLILIGRSALDHRQQARLREIRDAGAQVSYHRVDLTDAEALERLVDGIRAEHGGLNGVLHGAGINRDRLLARKSPQDVIDVFAAKVIGAELLDRACRGLYLDFFVLFSSCSAVLGSVGQADYAAANAFMDHFAGLRNRRVEQGQRFGHTLSINYPLWQDGGMRVSADDLAAIRRKTGMAPMQSAHGIEALQLGLSAGLERLLVIEGDLPRIRAHLAAAADAEAPAMTGAGTADPAAPADDNVDRDRLAAATLERLKAVFCDVTRLPAGRVESDVPLEQYGIDSIMITRLNRALEGVFSRMTALRPAESQLSKTLFFEYHSLDALAAYLVKRHDRACLLWTGLDGAQNGAQNREAAQRRTPSEAAAAAAPTAALEPIAVIGISGRYPQAADLDAYWNNLKAGRDSITEIPAQRWPLEDFYVDSMQEAVKQGRSYSKWGGFLDGFAEFDPLFFNISPREAVNMDPQERLFLQSCWHALEDAGITKAELAARYQGHVGVFVGITKTGYGLYGPALREQGHLVFPRTSFGSAANRVSYVLGLNGPSEPVDTMCSSSLTALHRACESLRRGECHMALAGGVNLYLHPSNYVELCAGQMLSKDGRCRSFGEGGNGFVPGEGVGVLLLKPLSRALADGDNVHAVIRATAVNHGGKTNGYTVPNPQAQARVIRLAIERAGLDASRISYIEAHGTGTELGDPIEVSGLSHAFAMDGVAPGRCALGSVKANIGHLEAAAGIAGVSKVILQLKHGQIAPSLHAARLNPNLALETTPFYLQQALADWQPPADGPRIAGVSSFGAGGANAHVLLQEHEEYRAPPDSSHAEAILLSARDAARLRAYAEALLAYVEARPRLSGSDLVNLAYTLQTGREMMPVRLGLVAESPAGLAAKLRAFIDSGGQAGDGIYLGDIKRKRSAAQADEGPAPALRDGANAGTGDAGDLHRLLARWVDGAAIDWPLLYTGRPGPRPYRISLPVYPFARETFWLPEREPPTGGRIAGDIRNVGSTAGGRAQAATAAEAAVAAAAASTTCDRLGYLARWQPDGPAGEPWIGEHRCVLIVAAPSAGAAAGAIADAYLGSTGFVAGGGRVIRLEPGQRNRMLAADHWSLDVADPPALDRCLDGCAAIDCLYFIGSAGEPTDWTALFDSPQYNEILLLRLIQWLKQHGSGRSIDCYIVSQDNFDLAGEPVSAFGGGLTGMAYAIAQGEHRFRVRNIDVDSRELADSRRLPQLVRQLRSERGLARGEALCLRDGERYRQRIFPLAWQPVPAECDGVTPALKRGGVYVILGGSGTVGGIISRYLLADYQATVVWLGRSRADDPKVRQRLERCLHSVGCLVDGRAAPGRLDYLQADATDPAALQRAVAQIRQRYGAINGAMFSGVVFSHDASITRMPEPAFREILEVKSRGGIAFYRAFAGEPLDFMCYFSSAQSFAFSGAARLAAYAAGITFADSLVRSLRRHAAFPVGAIHWGFWRASLAEQQAADPSVQPMSRHAGALDDREGFACFARFIDALSRGLLDHAICMAASAPVQQLMQLQPEPIGPGTGGGQRPADGFARYRAAAAPLLAAHDPEPFNQAMAGMTLVQLCSMGLFGQPGSFEDSETLRRQAGIGDHYGRWWSTCIDLLQQHGLVQRRGAQVCVGEHASAQQRQQLAERWHLLSGELKAAPQRKAQVELVDTCLRQLPAILRGRIQPTDVLFPKASMEKVEGVYRNNALSDYFNQVVAGVVQQHIETLLAKAPRRRIRILEIGAGTGGTTSIVLLALQPWREHLAEYCYTDLSKAFLMHARKTYGAANPFLTYQLWDVEQPPEAQGLERGAYDIVIAANVLHATGRMRRTVGHAKTVLRQGGILVMNEISDRSLFSHLTFGLLKGWWLYEDPELRIPGTPALSPESWAGLLGDAGFRNVAFPAACAHCLGQQIIVAESDGLAPPPAEEGPGQARGIPQPRGGRDQENDAGVAETGGGRDALIAMARNSLARTLQLAPERIAADQPFADYGIDSILGVGFVGQLGEALGAELNTALLFDYPTLESLVDYLLGQHPAQSARLAGVGGDRSALADAAGPAACLDPVVGADAEVTCREAVAARVVEGLAGALQLDPAQIDREQPFSDYGLDSILGAGFVDALGSVLGVELSAAILFDYPTVATLSAYITENLRTAMAVSPNGLDHAVSASNNVRGQSRPIEIQPPFAAQLEGLFLSGELSIDSLLNIVSPGVTETREVTI
ncbi:SDR family NAD(P)-dependent oxidoreductase [Ralstonia pseudosolanacearum]|uniref:RhiC polyketide synthase, rhizoxin biosynthesis n=1 Tax=Ralstonia solanacearum TaxID=305 RepID=A0A0S4TPR7_RALSL|nr:polyketide synthase [Ralstonia solanacearum]CUV11651.1 RhiC polyketide synthase, rhizoxin biosynthesis [Ralstonia solanacearum]